MAKDKAKLRIGGDAKGANRANKQVEKGLKSLGKAGKEAGKDIAAGAKQATKAEKQFEAEVQKAIKRLEQKEQRAKAASVAQRRMGGGGAGLPRPVHQAGGGLRPQVKGAFEGLSRMQGAAGGVFGNVGASLGAGGGLAALGVAAAGVGAGLQLLRSRIQAAAEAAERMADIEQARADAIRSGKDALGKQVLQTAGGFQGQGMAAMSLRGASLGDISRVMEHTGLDQQVSAQIAGIIQGVSKATQARLIQLATDASFVGGDPVQAVAYAKDVAMQNGGKLNVSYGSGQSKGSNSDEIWDRERVELLSMVDPGLAANFNPSRMRNAVGRRFSDARNIEQLQFANNMASVAAVDNVATEEGRREAHRIAFENAAAVDDPVKHALKELDKHMQKELEKLDKIIEALGPLGRLVDEIKGGAGLNGYSAQAAQLRAARGY